VDRAPERIEDAGRALDAGTAVGEALEALRAAVGADRVSVAELDPTDGAFAILAASGERLLPLGERFAIDDSTHFALAADGAPFVTTDFARDPRFRRPVDERVREHGFRSGAALPLESRSGSGALALHFRSSGNRAERAARLLAPVARALGTAVARARATAIDVVVLDEDPLTGRGLLHVLGETPGLRARRETSGRRAGVGGPDVVVATAADGRPDHAVRRVRADGVDAPVVVVSGPDSPELRAAALDAGAAGIVPRADVVGALADALRVAADGGTWLPGPVGDPARELLSARELEVVVLLDRGLRLAEIGAELGIAHATVKAHTRNVFRKLGASSRAEACFQARRAGLLR
jgi:DNA-binding NarL/FixJ family response regulator